MIKRNIEEGWIDYGCNIIVGSLDGEKNVWVEMITPEFGKMVSPGVKATDDPAINHQLGESLIDELINRYEYKLKIRANS